MICSRCGRDTELRCTMCQAVHTGACKDGDEYELWCWPCLEYMNEAYADMMQALRREELYFGARLPELDSEGES